jgi:ribonuclease E
MRPESAEDAEAGRRRRRRRRRRGGERPFGESLLADAPQPTDAGLAVMAEIGGDLMAAGRAETTERRRRDDGDRGRRRRQRGGHRSPPAETDRLPATGGDFAEGELETAEAGLSSELTAASLEAKPNAPEAAIAEHPASVRDERSREGLGDEMETPERRSPPGVDAAESRDAESVRSSESERVEPAPSPEPGRVERPPLVEPTADQSSPAEHEESRAAEPPAEQEPARPRRTGWWQRARASIVGD